MLEKELCQSRCPVGKSSPGQSSCGPGNIGHQAGRCTHTRRPCTVTWGQGEPGEPQELGAGSTPCWQGLKAVLSS